MNLKQWTLGAGGHMVCGIFLLFVFEAASQDGKESICEAEHGKACETVASSMMQTHVVRQKSDVQESDETEFESESAEQKYWASEQDYAESTEFEYDAQQSAKLTIEKHGDYDLRIFSNSHVYRDGRFSWVIFDTNGNCDESFTTKLKTDCLAPGAKILDCGHPENGGSCHCVVKASTAEIKEEIDKCKKFFNKKDMIFEADASWGLPDEEDVDAVPGALFETEKALPWGLDRIDQTDLPLSSSYSPSAGGTGVNVYVADTGIYINHNDFGGRAKAAFDQATNGQIQKCDKNDPGCAYDKQGHGTHCAGTIGGRTYGVANNVNLHAVKILSDRGSGSFSWFINGINFVEEKHRQDAKPAIVSASLGGRGTHATVKAAIDKATQSGIMVVVAAGNSNADACGYSPAFVPTAITVGSTTNTDKRSGFSSFGPCLDVFAPGSGILSAYPGNPSNSRTLSGTSMACPHVSGALALLIDKNPTSDAKSIEQLLKSMTVKKVQDAKSNNGDGLLQVTPGSWKPPAPVPTPPFTPRPTPSPKPTPSPTPAPPVAPSDCSFESGEQCFWTNPKSDKFDWTRRSGGTPSSGTGPSSAADGRTYVFTETSSPRRSGDTAILESPPINMPAAPMKLEFKYHMYGSDMGSLSVAVGGSRVFRKNGNQGNSWKVGTIDLSTHAGKQISKIQFVGVRGKSYRGDMAIDAVKFVPSGPTPPPTPAPPTPPVVTIGASRGNKKCVRMPNTVCPKDAGNKGKRLNTDYPDAKDTFDITHENQGDICARRTDSTNGWGMNLQLKCAPGTPPTLAPTPAPATPAPPAPTPAPTPTPPVVVVGPAGPPGPPGPPGKTITNVGPPGPPGPPR